jgi:hypothetical protein
VKRAGESIGKKKSGENKIKWMTVFILIRKTSRYLCSQYVEYLPSEIAPGGTVRTQPCSDGVMTIRHRIKASLQTLDGTLVWT